MLSTGIPELDEPEGELTEQLSSQRCREIRKLESLAKDIVVGATERIEKRRRTDRRRQRRYRVWICIIFHFSCNVHTNCAEDTVFTKCTSATYLSRRFLQGNPFVTDDEDDNVVYHDNELALRVLAENTDDEASNEVREDNSGAATAHVADDANPDVADHARTDVDDGANPDVADDANHDVADDAPTDVADGAHHDVADDNLADDANPDGADDANTDVADGANTDVADGANPDVADDAATDVADGGSDVAARADDKRLTAA